MPDIRYTVKAVFHFWSCPELSQGGHAVGSTESNPGFEKTAGLSLDNVFYFILLNMESKSSGGQFAAEIVLKFQIRAGKICARMIRVDVPLTGDVQK